MPRFHSLAPLQQVSPTNQLPVAQHADILSPGTVHVSDAEVVAVTSPPRPSAASALSPPGTVTVPPPLATGVGAAGPRLSRASAGAAGPGTGSRHSGNSQHTGTGMSQHEEAAPPRHAARQGATRTHGLTAVEQYVNSVVDASRSEYMRSLAGREVTQALPPRKRPWVGEGKTAVRPVLVIDDPQ